MSKPVQPSPSYEELAALVGVLAARMESLEAENVELRRRLGMNSRNSGTPSSKQSIEAVAKRKAVRQSSQRTRSKERKPGGQKGRQGSGLQPARGDDLDRTERVVAPVQCSSCRADLIDATDVGAAWAQVWDIAPVVLEKVAWVLPRRRCRCCGRTTTAGAPFAQAGSVTYGPNVNAAAVLLGSEGNVPIERTAMLVEALLGAPVSSGFIVRAAERLSDRLEAAGFDEAIRQALRAEEVLCADETPVNIARKDLDANGDPVPGAEHVVTFRTPDERLVLLSATSSRSTAAIKGIGVIDGWTGYLVRDDYVGWHCFDATLAGVGQCGAHVIRHLQGVLDLHATWQGWAGEVQTVLREANQAVTQAKARGEDNLSPELLVSLRQRYDQAVAWGQTTNMHRDWHKGNHPGYNLAKRLANKADQVWLWTVNFAVPWTNNAAERALKSPKLHQKVSGYWHTLATATRFCRVRSYLTSARNHGIRPIDAIHTALTGNPWLPTPTGA